MREVKNSERLQSISNRKDHEQSTSKIETPKCTDDKVSEKKRI